MLRKFLWLNVQYLAGLCLSVLLVSSVAQAQKYETAVFAGGCFWCVESDFDRVLGVIETVSGYTGGAGANPTYQNYARNGHVEVVKITFDPQKTTYKKLLDVFWHSVNPTDPGGQFCDRGPAYSTAIFAQNRKQGAIARASKSALIKKHADKNIVTPIRGATRFFPAENYHQGYAMRNPIRYKFYRSSCGRDRDVKKVWGKTAHRGIAKH